MHSRSVVEVGLDRRGRTVLRRNYNEPAQLARAVSEHDGSLTIWMVAGAAGPIGGDALALEVIARQGSAVTVCSVAATIALPGPSGEWSSSRLDLIAEPGAHLRWCGPSLVVASCCRHRSTTTVHAAGDAAVYVADTVVLGRSDEEPGTAMVRQRVFDDDALVLDHEAHLGPGPLSNAGANGRFRHHVGELVVGSVEGAVVRRRSSVERDWVAAQFPVGRRTGFGVAAASCPSSLAAARRWLGERGDDADDPNSPTSGNRGETSGS